MDSHKKAFEGLAALADIRVNGDRPWDIRVVNEGFYRRVLRDGSFGLGESYMDGWWECARIDELTERILRANLQRRVYLSWRLLLGALGAWVLNLQRRSKAFHVGERHYDIGNDLYRAMLDRRMTYSCGYWKDARNLGEAQEAKLDLICEKLGLAPGMRVLDIGCGWGSFAKYAAEKYGVEVVGTTVSKEQLALGRELCKGLPVTLKLEDYRETTGAFDRVVSVGMFEHVGYKNYRHFMKVVRRALKDDGLFLLHTIGGNRSAVSGNPWLAKYIFPRGMLPSIRQIGAAIEGLFVMEDWHSFGADYAKTTLAWFGNFEKSWDGLKEKYGARFYRMWKYYLLSSAGAARARHMQLWQVVLSPRGVAGGYRSFR